MHTGWQEFLRLCVQMQTTEELEKLFELFLTYEEKNDLAKRFLIVQALLENKMPQREMAKSLNVSIAKITRGSNQLKVMSDDFKNMMSDTIQQQQQQQK